MNNIEQIESLKLIGNIPANWLRWKQRWNLYLKASGSETKTGDIQCTLFLHLIGEDAPRIYNTFTFNDEEKDKLESYSYTNI